MDQREHDTAHGDRTNRGLDREPADRRPGLWIGVGLLVILLGYALIASGVLGA